jgi:PAS domain S-box-containing protein
MALQKPFDQPKPSDHVKLSLDLEENFRVLFDENPVPTLLSEMPSGKIAFVNGRLAALLGKDPESVIGKTANDLGLLKNPADQEKLTALIAGQGYADNVEVDRISPAGEHGTERVSMRLITINKKAYCLTVLQDITERQRAEESLRKSEERYRRLVETTGTGYVILDDKGSVLDANPEYVRLSGHEKLDEILGRSVVEWTADEEKDANSRAVAACLKNGTIRNLEITYSDKSGRRTPVEINATVVESECGQKILSLCRDISERRKAESQRESALEALRLRESYLSAIIENQPGLLWLKDRHGKFLSVNKAFSNSCGQDNPELLVGKTDFDVWPHDLAAGYVADDARVMQSGKPCMVEEPISDKGTIHWFETFKAPLMSKQGTVIGTTGYSRDITERKRAEEELRNSKEVLELIFKISPDAAVITRLSDGLIADINERFVTMSGYSRNETIGKTSVELNLYDNTDSRQKVIDELGRNGYCQNIEIAFRTKSSGTIIGIMSSQIVPLYGVPHVYSIIRDITEFKKTESLLMNAQKLDSLGVLAGGIAHDFNNLLTGIFGYISLARSVTRDPKAVEYLESTLATMNRAKSLTLQLLTFAKGGAPVQKITPITQFIQETVQFALSGSNISCTFFLAENLWPCNIDKNQIGQVIDNIVINAQQAMPNGGTIEVTADNIYLGKNENPPLPKAHYVKISIKDNGIGIPMDIIPRIFDPFYTTKTKGHGLGLATCYSIINRHGGCITVESEPGRGSTFHVFLPASPEAIVADKTSNINHSGSGTIILMDDEEVIRGTIGKMLESLGYTVVCKNDGSEVLDFYINETKANRKFAAMIFDLTVPGGMGGVEAVSKIRKLSTGAEIPVFVASGYADDSVMKKPAEFGFTASISKPFTIVELSEMLNKNLKF